MIYAWTDTSMLQFSFGFLLLLSTIDFECARFDFQKQSTSYVAAPCLSAPHYQLTSAQTSVIYHFIHARISYSFRHSCSTGQLAYVYIFFVSFFRQKSLHLRHSSFLTFLLHLFCNVSLCSPRQSRWKSTFSASQLSHIFISARCACSDSHDSFFSSLQYARIFLPHCLFQFYDTLSLPYMILSCVLRFSHIASYQPNCLISILLPSRAL